MKNLFSTLLLSSISIGLFSQNTSINGNWSDRYTKIRNTSEAEMMIRHGDIDNLGIGFGNADPFSGYTVQSRYTTLEHDPADADGFDRVMVVSSYDPSKVTSTHSGYHTTAPALKSKYGKTVFELNLEQKPDSDLRVNKVEIQMFLVDVQSAIMNMKYKFYINKKHAAFLDPYINALDLSGEKGRFISAIVPDEFKNDFLQNKISLLIDDSLSGQSDGFAIDFVKILYNPVKPYNSPRNRDSIITANDHPGKIRLVFNFPDTSKFSSRPTLTLMSNGKEYYSKSPRLLMDVPSGKNEFKVTTPGHADAIVVIEVKPNTVHYGTLSVSMKDPKKTIYTESRVTQMNNNGSTSPFDQNNFVNSLFMNILKPGLLQNRNPANVANGINNIIQNMPKKR